MNHFLLCRAYNSIYSFITALIHPSSCISHQASCSLALLQSLISLCPFTLHFCQGWTWIYLNNTLIWICLQSSGSYFIWTNFDSYFDGYVIGINLKYSVVVVIIFIKMCLYYLLFLLLRIKSVFPFLCCFMLRTLECEPWYSECMCWIVIQYS